MSKKLTRKQIELLNLIEAEVEDLIKQEGEKPQLTRIIEAVRSLFGERSDKFTWETGDIEILSPPEAGRKRRSALAPDLITVKQAAEVLQITPESIYLKKCGTDKLQIIKRGGKRYVDYHSVLALRGPEELITVRDAAEMLSISPGSIYAYKAGTERLRRKRLGARVFLVRKEVEAMVRRRY